MHLQVGRINDFKFVPTMVPRVMHDFSYPVQHPSLGGLCINMENRMEKVMVNELETATVYGLRHQDPQSTLTRHH